MKKNKFKELGCELLSHVLPPLAGKSKARLEVKCNRKK